MNALPVPLYLAVKDCVLVLGQHLLLSGHLLLPAGQRVQRLALLGKCRTERVNNRVDGLQPLALAEFLEPRQPPWDFPREREDGLVVDGGEIKLVDHDARTIADRR